MDLATRPPDSICDQGERDDFAIVEVVHSPHDETALASRKLVAPAFVDLIFQLLSAQDVRSLDVVVRLQADIEELLTVPGNGAQWANISGWQQPILAWLRRICTLDVGTTEQQAQSALHSALTVIRQVLFSVTLTGCDGAREVDRTLAFCEQFFSGVESDASACSSTTSTSAAYPGRTSKSPYVHVEVEDDADDVTTVGDVRAAARRAAARINAARGKSEDDENQQSVLSMSDRTPLSPTRVVRQGNSDGDSPSPSQGPLQGLATHVDAVAATQSHDLKMHLSNDPSKGGASGLPQETVSQDAAFEKVAENSNPRVIIHARDLTARILNGLLRDLNQHFGLCHCGAISVDLARNTLHLIFLAETALFGSRGGPVKKVHSDVERVLQQAVLRLATTLGIKISEDFGPLQPAADDIVSGCVQKW